MQQSALKKNEKQKQKTYKLFLKFRFTIYNCVFNYKRSFFKLHFLLNVKYWYFLNALLLYFHFTETKI